MAQIQVGNKSAGQSNIYSNYILLFQSSSVILTTEDFL